MLHPVDRTFMRRLLQQIQDEAGTRVEQVAMGSAKDYADYQNRCGYLQALEDVRKWCREIAESDDENPPRPK